MNQIPYELIFGEKYWLIFKKLTIMKILLFVP